VCDIITKAVTANLSLWQMMELNDAMEKKALEQALADDESGMSFEELLEEEKKDAAFWWRDGKLRSISDCK
jgi:hypothetical protein